MRTRTNFWKPIWIIATSSYREMVRDRILYGIFLIAALITGSSFFMATISLGQDSRILQNLGLAAIHLCTFAICTFVTAIAISREYERRTLYLLFPKPISRGQYVLGKYVGSLLLLLSSLVILGGILCLGMLAIDRTLIAGTIFSLGASFLEISLLTALTIFFSSFAAPLNAALYTTALFFIGHSLPTLKLYADRFGSRFSKGLVDLAYYLLPNLEKFSVRQALLYHLSIPPTAVTWSIIYWAIYTGLALIVAVQVIRRREV